MKIFNLPDLGEGLPDAEITEWHVKVGDEVKTDAPLVSMETAKAVVDVPSPFSGKIAKLHGEAGDIIKTGAPLVEFEVNEEEIRDTGTVAGEIKVGSEVIDETASVSLGNKAASGIKVTPAVRALAKKLGVDLSSVQATGPNSTITAQDVKAAHENLQNLPELIPLKGVRRAMAQSMQQSHAEVVPVSIFDEANLHAWHDNNDITARLIRAICVAVKAEPALNAWYDANQVGRRLMPEVNLGLAMDTEDGLFVPVIKDASNINQADLRAKIKTLKQTVGDRSIAPDELRNQTITLSNFGKFAGRFASPIIVPPQVAIIAAGKITVESKVVNNEIKPCKVLPLSLSFDHRGVTGGEATRFFGAMLADLQLAD